MNEKETYLDLMETSIDGMGPSERHSTMQSFQMNALYAQVFALASIAESLARIADVTEAGPAETTESRATFRALRDSY